MATSLKAVQLNTAPPYIITCDRDDGTIIDLTNTTVTMKLFRGTTQTNITAGHDACTIVNATLGQMSWQPGTNDLPSPGSYKGDVKVTYPGGTFEVLYGQLLIKVRKLLGT
jgi:hypothetical protein